MPNIKVMSNESYSSSLPSSPQDISRFMRTATDAVNDLGQSVPVNSLKEKVIEIKDTTVDYANKYPLRTMGAAFAVGFLLGWYCSGGCRDSK